MEESSKELTRAKNTVFRLFKIRQQSEKEVIEKLQRKQIPTEAIKKAVRYFTELELIDDRKFAKGWINARLKKPFGFNRIRQELKNKGIAQDIIDEELAKATSDYPQSEVVVALAKRRAEKYYDIPEEKIKQRVYGYLVRRGFHSADIFKALKELFK